MRFVDAHSPSGVCTPTRYALLTGRYTWRTRLTRGVLGGYSPPLLEPDRPTLGTLLQAQGYRTAAIGKWHLGMEMPYLDPAAERTEPWEGDPGIDFGGTIADSPIHHGFDEYFGVSASLDMAPYVYIRNDRFTALPTHEQPAVPFPYFIRHGPRADDFGIDEVLDRLVDEAVDFIDRSAQTDGPFFLYLPLTAPHKPTRPHERFRGRTGLGEYDDFVAQVDAAVGQVLAALERVGARDETLVIFTSDNGSYMYRRGNAEPDHVIDPSIQAYRVGRHRSNADWRGTKADIWEGGHRVPFVARWPGVVEPGSETAATIVHTDIYATLADIVGAAPSPDAAEDSVSLLPMLRGEPATRGVPVVHHSSGGMFAIRDGAWKLMFGNGSGGRQEPRGEPFGRPYQLFDLSRDPALGEVRLLVADTASGRQRCARLLESAHPLGRSRAPGCRLTYLLESEAGPVGVLSFVSAPLRLGPRDAHLGWDDRTRAWHIGQVVSNDRFLLLPGVRVPHLASHVLGRAVGRLASDWEVRHGIRPVLVETCVEASRPATAIGRRAGCAWAGRRVGRRGRPVRSSRRGCGCGAWKRPGRRRCGGGRRERRGPFRRLRPKTRRVGGGASSDARTWPTGACGRVWSGWGWPGSGIRASRCRRSFRAVPSNRRRTVSCTITGWAATTFCNRTGRRWWSAAGRSRRYCWCRIRRR